MSNFKVVIGDLFADQADVLVNTVNCVGVMGKGVALEFKKRFPRMYDDYVVRCAQKRVRLGEPYLYSDLAGEKVVNFPTKDHWRSASRIKDIESGLDYLAGHYAEWGIESIALPPLGCGNGGLEWSEVGPLIFRKLSKLPLAVTVYAPYGTPKTELSNDFLATPSQMTLDGKGRRHERLNPNWVVLMEILQELQAQPYANPVGRTIFQKLCYVVTEMGVPTGFNFGKGSFGPYSADVNTALQDFANRNWMQEKPLGRMVSLNVGPEYSRDRTKFLSLIDENKKKIDKAVDLFSRIKDTEQAEEVLTVLFASRQLKQKSNDRIVDEQQIFQFIFDWKKSWNNDAKKEAIGSAITNLATLGWMRVTLAGATPSETNY